MQFVLIVKLWPRRTRWQGNARMVALLFEQASENPTVPAHVVSFGTHRLSGQPKTSLEHNYPMLHPAFRGLGHADDAVCSQRGMDLYQLQLSIAELYHNADRLPDGIDAYLIHRGPSLTYH